MNEVGKFLIFIIPLILFIILISIGIVLIIKNVKRIKYNKVVEEIKKSLGPNLETVYFSNNKAYDIFGETEYAKYYIKVYSVPKDSYLKLDTNYNYFLYTKDKVKNITNDLKLISHKFNVIDTEKRVNKVIVLYPSVSQKLYYKSNVEGRFIYTQSEFQGVRIINFDEINLFMQEMQ